MPVPHSHHSPTSRSRHPQGALSLNTRIGEGGVQSQIHISPVSSRHHHSLSNHGVQLVRPTTAMSSSSSGSYGQDHSHGHGHPPTSYSSSSHSHAQRKKSTSPTGYNHPNPLGLPSLTNNNNTLPQHRPFLNSNTYEHLQTPSSNSGLTSKRVCILS